LKLGFVPFDYTKAGVVGEEWRKLAAARTYAPTQFGEKPVAPPLNLRSGFEDPVAPGTVPFAKAETGGRNESISRSMKRRAKAPNASSSRTDRM
jgi:hypothetical protein